MNWQNSGYNLGDATWASQTGLSCRALSRCIMPVVHAWALVQQPNTTRFPGRRPGGPDSTPSIDAVVPRAQPPHFWAHSLNPVKPILVVRIL